jgi:hypothetical protein
VDKTGQVEDADNGQLMIDLGYAEPVNYIDMHPRHTDFTDPENKEPKPKKKR